MILYLRLAWRNLWRHRRRTLIVVLSIGVSMALMMMYDGLITGFEDAIYGNAIRMLGGNIQIHGAGYSEETGGNALIPLENDQALVQAAKANPQVASAARRIITGGMASNRAGAFAVSIIGIEPEQEASYSLIAQNVSAGRFLQSGDADVIFIGQGLATAMEITVGDRITLVGRGTHQQMRQRTMTVSGIYDVGMPDLEKRSIYIALGEAQDLYGLSGQITEVAITLHQLGQEAQVVAALTPALGSSEITTWETSFPELQQAINTKGGAMDVFGVIILFIAGIGILNLLLMAVYERTREIGVMGALGMRPRQISALFLLEGVMMGMIGLALGVVFGLVFNISLGQVGLDYSQFTSLTEYTALISGRIYPTLGLEKLLQRGITVVIISLLSAFIPAREASQSEPAKALHFV